MGNIFACFKRPPEPSIKIFAANIKDVLDIRHSGSPRNSKHFDSLTHPGVNTLAAYNTVLKLLNINVPTILDHDPHNNYMLLTLSENIPLHLCRLVWSFNHFEIASVIHIGNVSRVYKSKDPNTNFLVTTKRYWLEHRCAIERVHLYREITIHPSLHHNNIAQFYASFKENSEVIIMMEYIKGFTLREYLHMNGGVLPEKEIVNLVLRPIICVLSYMHDQGIVHRDLKPENIMITTDGNLKLIDFGLAINVNDEPAKTRAGTLPYMAPEILINLPNSVISDIPYCLYDKSVDVWAVGIITYELIVGTTPFASNTLEGCMTNLSKRKIYVPLNISKHARDFILQILVWDRHERPPVQQLLTHPFLTKFDSRVRRHSVS